MRFNETETTVVAGQLRSRAYHTKIKVSAAKLTRIVFDGSNQGASESFALLVRRNREHAQVCPFVALLQVNAAKKPPTFRFEEKELSFVGHVFDLGKIGAFLVEDEALDLVGTIDQHDDGREIGSIRDANSRALGLSLRVH